MFLVCILRFHAQVAFIWSQCDFWVFSWVEFHLFCFCFQLWLRLQFLFQVICCCQILLFSCCLVLRLLFCCQIIFSWFIVLCYTLFYSTVVVFASCVIRFFQVLIVVDIVFDVFVYKFWDVIHHGLLAGFWYDVIVDMVSTCILLGFLYHSHDNIHTDWSHPDLQDGRRRCPVRIRQVTQVFLASASFSPRSCRARWSMVRWSVSCPFFRFQGSIFPFVFHFLSGLYKVRLSRAVAFVSLGIKARGTCHFRFHCVLYKLKKVRCYLAAILDLWGVVIHDWFSFNPLPWQSKARYRDQNRFLKWYGSKKDWIFDIFAIVLIYANQVNYEKRSIAIIRHPAVSNNSSFCVIKAQGTFHFHVHCVLKKLANSKCWCYLAAILDLC